MIGKLNEVKVNEYNKIDEYESACRRIFPFSMRRQPRDNYPPETHTIVNILIHIITDEIAGLRNDLQAETDKLEKTRDGLSERLQTTENELQTALQAEKTAHEEDVERLSREKV